MNIQIYINTHGYNSKYEHLNINTQYICELKLTCDTWVKTKNRTRERENVSILIFVVTALLEYMFVESSKFHSDKFEQISPQIKIVL